MALRKLTPSEIKSTVGKIRLKYDEYHYKYFKPTKHKHNFEERYIAALKSGFDISTFLLAEIQAIEELLKREEQKVMTKAPPKPAPVAAPARDFADKVIQENMKKIQKYSDIKFHQDANEEVRRLYGALHALEQEFWPMLYGILRNTMYSLNTKTMMAMENQLHVLGGTGKEGVAARLDRYIAHLKRFPRDYAMIDKEEKDYILETSFFLHEFSEILGAAYEKYKMAMAAEDQNQLIQISDYVNQMIADFRLKDLKRR